MVILKIHFHLNFDIALQLKFEDDLQITKMYSGEGEEVAFKEKLYPKGNVEDWLLEVERVMKESLRLTIKEALDEYPTVSIVMFKF